MIILYLTWISGGNFKALVVYDYNNSGSSQLIEVIMVMEILIAVAIMVGQRLQAIIIGKMETFIIIPLT